MNHKQIPFNLDKALAGEPVVARDGTEVTQLHMFDLASDDLASDHYCIAGVHCGQLKTWQRNGKFLRGEDYGLDLFMAPQVMQRWTRLYRVENICIPGGFESFADISTTPKGTTAKWVHNESGYITEPILLCEWVEE